MTLEQPTMNNSVFIARMDEQFPSGTSPYSNNTARSLVKRLLLDAGWDSSNGSTSGWNPFGTIIRPGDRVILKPNWVHHENYSGHGLECMITHASVLEAVLDLVLLAKPGKISIGDAPIQGCDFRKLMAETGYQDLKAHYEKMGVSLSWYDFRRTVLTNPTGIWDRHTDLRPLEEYILYDLGTESLLEPISGDADHFRVTMYNPDLMRQTHAPGRHQYLIAREVIEADVVINLPKLKTHKKAGLTGALKNLVGINGNKDYLPHHRLGGSRTKGDCYQGGSLFKLTSEHLRDAAYRRKGILSYLLLQIAKCCNGLAWLTGAGRELAGSWYGNDTIWRTCLDLDRILLYGRKDGYMSEVPQRKLVTITDAIVCGEGDGPLAPTPHFLGMLTMALNPVAAEFVHAHLMGLDWRKIPLIREAFEQFKYPLRNFRPEDLEVFFDGQIFHQPWPLWNKQPFIIPKGWKGNCEKSL